MKKSFYKAAGLALIVLLSASCAGPQSQNRDVKADASLGLIPADSGDESGRDAQEEVLDLHKAQSETQRHQLERQITDPNLNQDLR